METVDWARKEVDLAVKCELLKHNHSNSTLINDCDDRVIEYAIECYNTALKAYELLHNEGSSGEDIQFTKSVLNALIDGRPLTAIEDTDDVWVDVNNLTLRIHNKEYQCTRAPSLFKTIHEDGTISYNDVNRVLGRNEDKGYDCSFRSLNDIINQRFPIKMPYYPTTAPYIVYFKDLLFDVDNGDFDTLYVSHCLDPYGRMHHLDLYLKLEDEHDVNFIEISKAEYDIRKWAIDNR